MSTQIEVRVFNIINGDNDEFQLWDIEAVFNTWEDAIEFSEDNQYIVYAKTENSKGLSHHEHHFFAFGDEVTVCTLKQLIKAAQMGYIQAAKYL